MARKRTILLVEDEALAVITLQDIIELWGHTLCGMASNGIAALHIAQEHKPDCILMDIRLNGELDGIETARRIRAMSNADIIFMTGYAADEYKAQAQTLSPLAFIEKPIDYAQLKAILEQA